MEEDDVHLFFTCHFVRIAWFSAPWFICTDIITQNCSSLTQIILNLLNMGHPHASLQNILTFMWCIWKSRNDCLFDRKKGAPHQININAQALSNDLEVQELSMPPFQVQRQVQTSKDNHPEPPGSTIRTDQKITGPKVYSDAAWKTTKSPGTNENRTGIGIVCHFQEGEHAIKVFVQAYTSLATSPLQAEAWALLLAAKLATALQLHQVSFLTDNLALARAAAASSATDPQSLWKIRSLVSSFKQVSQELQPMIYHITRDLNGVAHNCAQQAIRSSPSGPIFSCISPAHRNMLCPIALALQNSILQGFVLNVVACS
jgi:ribonuclease HI